MFSALFHDGALIIFSYLLSDYATRAFNPLKKSLICTPLHNFLEAKLRILILQDIIYLFHFVFRGCYMFYSIFLTMLLNSSKCWKWSDNITLRDIFAIFRFEDCAPKNFFYFFYITKSIIFSLNYRQPGHYRQLGQLYLTRCCV